MVVREVGDSHAASAHMSERVKRMSKEVITMSVISVSYV